MITKGPNLPLSGHVDEASAYLVPDYPYGRTVRCRIRYYLENHPKLGARFCSQTEDPKRLRWNAPKKSTYSLFGGCMFLSFAHGGETGHVEWSGLNEYSEGEKVLAFVKEFKDHADLKILKQFLPPKIKYLQIKSKGTDGYAETAAKELPLWQEAGRLLEDSGPMMVALP